MLNLFLPMMSDEKNGCLKDGVNEFELEQIIYECPELPWTLGKGDSIYALNDRNYLFQNKSGSVSYYGTDGNFGMFAARYFLDDTGGKYEREDGAVIQRLFSDEIELTQGDVLGSFDVPKVIQSFISLAVSSVRRTALPVWVREGLKENIRFEIAPSFTEGIEFTVAVNGEYPTRYGGISSMQSSQTRGYLINGIKISFDILALTEFKCLTKFIKSGASVRVTRLVGDSGKAVLTWSSPDWEGTVITKAMIKESFEN